MRSFLIAAAALMALAVPTAPADAQRGHHWRSGQHVRHMPMHRQWRGHQPWRGHFRQHRFRGHPFVHHGRFGGHRFVHHRRFRGHPFLHHGGFGGHSTVVFIGGGFGSGFGWGHGCRTMWFDGWGWRCSW